MIWASSWDYVTYLMGDQRRLRVRTHEVWGQTNGPTKSEAFHWMAAHARLKNEFTEGEKCHHLVSWLFCRWKPQTFVHRYCRWRLPSNQDLLAQVVECNWLAEINDERKILWRFNDKKKKARTFVLAYQTRKSEIFTSAYKSYLTYPYPITTRVVNTLVV